MFLWHAEKLGSSSSIRCTRVRGAAPPHVEVNADQREGGLGAAADAAAAAAEAEVEAAKAAAPALTRYELDRAARMKRNRAMLEALFRGAEGVRGGELRADAAEPGESEEGDGEDADAAGGSGGGGGKRPRT